MPGTMKTRIREVQKRLWSAPAGSEAEQSLAEKLQGPVTFLIAFLIVFGGLHGFRLLDRQPGSWAVASEVIPELEKGYSVGAASGRPVTVFVDYACEECGELLGRLTAIADEGESIRLILKQLPAEESGTASQEASAAAVCAGEQGRVGQFSRYATDALRAPVPEVVSPGKLALDVGIPDTAAFKKCVAEGGGMLQVGQDQLEASRAGIAEAPAFVYAGTAYRGSRSMRELRRIVR